jgi:hypothetical protein
MKKKWITQWIPILLTAFLLYGCSFADSLNANSEDLPTDGIIQLNFDAEVLAYQTLENAANATFLEKIAAQARASRSKVSVNVYDDGTAEWRMEKLEPKHDVKIVDKTPANTMPQTKITRIDRTGKASFFDANHKLLHQDDMKMPSLVDFVAKVKKNPNAVYDLAGVKSVDNAQRIIQEAKNSGAVVKTLNDGLISIRTVTSKNNANAKVGTANDKYVSEAVYNPNLNILTSTTLYNKDNELLSRTVYTYKLNEKQELVPDANYSEMWDKDATGKTQKTVSNIYFNSLSATINLN